MSYQIHKSPDAERALRRLKNPTLARIYAAIGVLADSPRPTGCLKLTGLDEWRVRVGKLRIRYVILDDLETVIIIAIEPRDKAYKEH